MKYNFEEIFSYLGHLFTTERKLKMDIINKCVVCLEELNLKGKTDSIFSIDSTGRTCLAYRIFQMTGVQLIQEKGGKFACQDCHNILIAIIDLEKEFVKKFHIFTNRSGSLTRNITTPKIIKQDAPSHDTFEYNDEVLKLPDQPNQGTENEEMGDNDGFENVQRTEDNNEMVEYKKKNVRKRRKKMKNPKEDVIRIEEHEDESKEAMTSNEIDNGTKNLTEEELEDVLLKEATKLDKENKKKEKLNKPREKKILVCDYCAKTFACRENLLSHRRRFHTGEKPYTCSECGKSFADNSNYHRHIKIFHRQQEKKHQCDKCEKSFLLPHQLKQHHKTIHSDEKPFMCQVCPSKFPRSDYLKNHYKTHHMQKAELVQTNTFTIRGMESYQLYAMNSIN